MEECGHYMCAGLLDPKHQGGFRLLNQYGQSGPVVTTLHEAARQQVWDHTQAVLNTGRALQNKNNL